MRPYKPIVLPRKKPGRHQDWFEMLDAANVYSIKYAKEWHGDGVKNVSGWCVVSPSGHFLTSTFSSSRETAKAKCIEPALRKFKGIMTSLFSEWEKRGYRLVRVGWSIIK